MDIYNIYNTCVMQNAIGSSWFFCFCVSWLFAPQPDAKEDRSEREKEGAANMQVSSGEKKKNIVPVKGIDTCNASNAASTSTQRTPQCTQCTE